MKIQICFSTTNGIHSKLIRWFTKANVSHVYLKIFDQTFGTYLVLHADWDGVQFDLLDKFSINNFTIEEYEIDDPRLDEAIKKNLWYLGKAYDYYKLISWAWVIFFKRWFVRKIKDPIKDPKKIWCVDFVLYAFNSSGITHLPIGYFTQKDFQQWCLENYQSLGWIRKIYDDTPKRLK